MDERISTSNALLDSVLAEGLPSGKITVLKGRPRRESTMHKLYRANYAILDGKVMKDRNGHSEVNLSEVNLGTCKVVFWDEELGLLELRS